jgi:hypothetical protein
MIRKLACSGSIVLKLTFFTSGIVVDVKAYNFRGESVEGTIAVSDAPDTRVPIEIIDVGSLTSHTLMAAGALSHTT